MTAPLRTLQIGKSWLPEVGANGLDRMFYGLGQHLPPLGVEVSGLVAGTPDVDRQSSWAQSFAPTSAPLVRRLLRARQCGQALFEEKPIDLIACHFALYGLPLWDRLARTPTVIHFHGPWAAESAAEGESSVTIRGKKLLERCTYWAGQRFIVLSEAFRKVLVTSYGVSPDRIRIVPGGVDADAFDVDGSPTDARNRLGWPTDRPIILSVRRLARRMGLSNLIEAMETISRRHPDVLLLIAGKGPIREELEAQIQAKELEDHIQLLGFVPDEDLPYAYRAADVSVVPTVQHEGFGLITIESLAAGTPVLVTPVGGLPETVRDLDDRLVLPASSPEALQEGLGGALNGRLPLPDADTCQRWARST